MSIIIFPSVNLNNLMLSKVKKLKKLRRGEEYQSNLLEILCFKLFFMRLKFKSKF